MDNKVRAALEELLKSLLRPVIRFCLRRSLKLQDLLEAAKIVFLEVAEDEMEKRTLAVSRSRLSAMTGVHRRDVMRIYDHRERKTSNKDLVRKVVGQWQSDPRFTTRAGKPRILAVQSKESEFAQLVRAVSSDLNPYTVLFELERAGAVERSSKGLKLSAPVFLPKELQSGFEILSQDIDNMTEAVEENCSTAPETPNLHIRTEYDNIAADALPAVRKWLLHEGSELHRRARAFLSQFDRDINPEVTSAPAGVRVVLGAFSLTQSDLSSKQDHQKSLQAEVN